MRADVILEEISAYCRREGMAESTFGRRAVNDGKFVNRLRFGGKVNEATVEWPPKNLLLLASIRRKPTRLNAIKPETNQTALSRIC